VRSDETRERLRALGVRASKGLGQHFLLDERLADRHVELAQIEKTDVVLEIGPGLGILTRRLLRKASRVLAVEKDRRLARGLRELEGNLEVIEGDAVKLSLPPFDKVASNLPYQISSPITFRLLALPFERAALMYQKEFAERLVASPGTEDYSRLTVKAYVRCRGLIATRVPRAAFWPQPKVDSAIVVLEPRPFPFAVDDERLFDAVVDATFEHRRKTIENGLRLSWRRFAGSEAAFERMLDGAPYRRRRPEELTPEQFGELADALARGKG
jgi:16S rRNA (adenine1518-N6/adenine1519-N6)-dimethyltransferase